MSKSKQELLIDHLDSTLRGKGSREMEQLVANDQATSEEWRYLHIAVDAIRDAGLHEQVMAMRKEWEARQLISIATKSPKATVFTMYRQAMRIAACILVLMGGAAVYKYTTTNSAALYQEYYAAYDLNTNRGASSADPMEQAYNAKDWAGVISISNTVNHKNNKTRFLTGMAELGLKNYDDAAGQFGQIMADNAVTGGDYFQDEAEYYQAMSWLGGNELDKAMPLLEKIKADKHHLYHQIVDNMSFMDLHIAQFKSHK